MVFYSGGIYILAHKKWSMWSQLIAGFLLVISTTGFARLAYGVLMPFMQADLNINYTQAGLLATTISLGFLAISPLAGLLALKFGMKQVIMAGGFLVTVSFLFLSFSNSFYLYMLIMFFCGAGSALAFSPIMSLLVIQFQKKKGLVLGVLLSGVGSGMLLSGLMTTYLIRYFPVWEWRAIWIIFSITSILFTLLSWIVLKEPGKSVTNKDDSNQGVAHAYKNRKILRVGIIYFLIGLAYLIPILFQTSFMIHSGISERVAGSLFSISGLFTIIGGPIWGIVSDKVGRKKSLLVALAFCVMGGIIPVVDDHIISFMASAILFGFSIGGLMVLVQAMAVERSLPYLVPAVLGFITIFFATGQLLGPFLAGSIIEHLGGVREAYIFAIFIFFTALILTCFVSEKEKVVLET
ncbi:MFS transporter [Peribacillus sp. YIM B13472]|uniref:MFS transporter n=1 Tax=Peribacillus sp. YIM B13472 TaxID=3366297 RepID=UPI00366B1AED